MENIKVGDVFIETTLKNDSNNTFLPEHLRRMYKVYIIEKVNKVTFEVKGIKYREIPERWYRFDKYGTTGLEKTLVKRSVKYLTNFLDNNQLSCTYYKKDFLNALKGVSEEYKQMFNEMMITATASHYEKLKQKKIAEAERFAKCNIY